MQIGEIDSEGRTTLMDDEKPSISWENDLKDQI
jgi:hypothetical protein